MAKKRERQKTQQPFLSRHNALGLVIDATARESDRGFVLICAAVLDRALEKLIRTKWSTLSNATKKEMDYLFIQRPLPPLGSAQIRAKLARILGWIDKTVCQALCKLFDMRNDFAHKEIAPILDNTLIKPIFDILPWIGRDPNEIATHKTVRAELLVLTSILLRSVQQAETKIIPNDHPNKQLDR